MDDNNLGQKIHFDGATAFAFVKDCRKIHREIHSFDSVPWIPIYPLKNNFVESQYFQKDSNQVIFKFETPENTSVSDIDFIKTLTSCLRQIFPVFGNILSISGLEIPYAFIHEIYTIVEISDDKKMNINIFGNFYKLGKIDALKFEASENSKITLSILQTFFKKPIKMNLDQSLWRIGLDSLKIATLEFKLKALFEGAEFFEHGFCLKFESVRQLLEATNSLTLKKQTAKNLIKKCDLNLQKLPITEAQKQLLFLCKTKNGNEFVEEFYANFVEPLQIEKLEKALSQIYETNPSLKCIFEIDNARILSTAEALIIFTDIESFENYNFDAFSRPSLIFFIDGNKFAMKFHHILLDGKSLQLFVNQFMAFYYGIIYPSQNLNYFDFALFESHFLEKTNFSKDFDYWKNKLSIVENFPKLSKDSVFDSKDFSGSIISIEFPASLTAKLRAFSSLNSVSLFSTFIAFYRFFIYKLYGFSNFPVLISIDNRLDENFESTIGLFVNLATVSFSLNPSDNFEALLNQVLNDLNETISHSTVPFNRVISALRRELSMEPEILPEVMLVHDREATFKGVQIFASKKKKFVQNSQIWYLKEIDENLKLQIEFRTALFSEEIMQNQAKRFLILIEKVLQTPNLSALKSFDLLTKDEIDQFLEFRQSLSNPVPVISPIQLIFQKMQKNPGKIILKTSEQQLKSDVFMKRIIGYGETLKSVYEERFETSLPLSDQPVALLFNRSIDLVTLVLACWYLNLAPLMITPDWPISRISTSLKGFKNLLLITDNDKLEIDDNLFDDSVSIISIKTFQHLSAPNPTKSSHLTMASSNPTDLAYLTFTSGSTGIPKAVQSLQRGLINLWQNYSHSFSISSKSTVYQVVNPAFDIFFADIISALGNGGTLFLASQKIPKMDELKKCTHAYIMPAYLSQLDLENPHILEILKSLKAILYGGEPMNPNCLKKALDEGLNLFQQFGVTEHSIYSNFISPNDISDRLIVGQNFSNFHGYLIDSDGCRIPPINLGIQGWFRSAGIAVSRGYIGENIEKQNHELFGEEPWFDGWKYFDSGDRMKIISSRERHEDDEEEGEYDDDDANPWKYKFVFCGRNDTQIKIRGNRVEIRDVEEPFRRFSNVQEIVCLFDGKKLIAFVTLKNPSLTDEKDLRELAQEKLPIYMIPETFIILEKFPINSNGKIDRQKLFSMTTVADISQNPPKNDIKNKSSNDLSKLCCEIFAKHLKLSSILPEEDLFQKGADSLKLLMAVQEIEDSVGIKLDISTIFRQRSISNYP
uniref:Carrier domain-containing protein n=1 Tax=Panagrolaimus superbus TaxID=310955 RepID=A0A914ZFX5_9BILA